MKMKKFRELIKNPRKIIAALARRGMFRWLTDQQYLGLIYRMRIGKKLNLKQPASFNEKLQWLKIHERKPEFTRMVDKYEAKKYVAERIGEQYIIPTLGVWDRFEDIDFKTLPNQFVLKCTHDSGGLVICTDKSKLDMAAAKKKITRALKKNYYYLGREWPYKNIKPRIIADQFLNDGNKKELIDYKVLCFNGKAKCIFTCTDRFSEDGLKVTFYDLDWNRMPFERHYPADRKAISAPKSLNVMIDLAEKLARDLTFVRIDFYEADGKPYFGEITLSPGSGCEEFTPDEWDYRLGDWIRLPEREEL